VGPVGVKWAEQWAEPGSSADTPAGIRVFQRMSAANRRSSIFLVTGRLVEGEGGCAEQ
jgi:hypothetical protein